MSDPPPHLTSIPSNLHLTPLISTHQDCKGYKPTSEMQYYSKDDEWVVKDINDYVAYHVIKDTVYGLMLSTYSCNMKLPPGHKRFPLTSWTLFVSCDKLHSAGKKDACHAVLEMIDRYYLRDSYMDMSITNNLSISAQKRILTGCDEEADYVLTLMDNYGVYSPQDISYHLFVNVSEHFQDLHTQDHESSKTSAIYMIRLISFMVNKMDEGTLYDTLSMYEKASRLWYLKSFFSELKEEFFNMTDRRNSVY
ncbi:hypothetical protein HDU85_005897 [Gaertneriomyces sp. JEL0708]|nr:hypothetical protein HDU85_005897 [Gaertneriomyces sp. JEL0708]